jgi:hypothetical protein
MTRDRNAVTTTPDIDLKKDGFEAMHEFAMQVIEVLFTAASTCHGNGHNSRTECSIEVVPVGYVPAQDGEPLVTSHRLGSRWLQFETLGDRSLTVVRVQPTA